MTRAGYQKHKDVIDWFYTNRNKSPVLINKYGEWVETDDPDFSEDDDYLINDDYVEIRKAIYKGKKIEYHDIDYNKWRDLNLTDPNRFFIYISYRYRIKEEKDIK